jgi:hypothetical protein
LFITRSEESLHGLSFSVRRFVSSGPLARVAPSDFFLYGSFVRSVWSREPWEDINLAFRTDSARSEIDPVQLAKQRFSIAPLLYDHPATLLEEADFSVCQAVYCDGCFHLSAVFFEHLAQRLLVVARPLPPAAAYRSLCRVLKLTRRGYSISERDFSGLVQAAAGADASSLRAAALRNAGNVLLGPIEDCE